MGSLDNSRPDVIAIARKRRHALLIKKLGEGSLSKSDLSELEGFEQEHTKTSSSTVNTVRDAAKYFNVSTRTLFFWFEDGCPKRNDGKFDLDEMAAWKDARNAKNGTPDPDKTQDLKERIRGRQLKNEILAIELKRQKKILIDRDQVITDRITRIIIVKQALLAIPQLAPQLSHQEPRDVEATLNRVVKDIIDGFSGEAIESEPKPEPPEIKRRGRPPGTSKKKAMAHQQK